MLKLGFLTKNFTFILGMGSSRSDLFHPLHQHEVPSDRRVPSRDFRNFSSVGHLQLRVRAPSPARSLRRRRSSFGRRRLEVAAAD